MNLRHAEWAKQRDPHVEALARDERRVVRATQIQRAFNAPMLLLLNLTAMGLPYLPNQLKFVCCIPAVISLTLYIGFIRLRRASPELREWLAEEPSDVPQHRVRMDLWRYGSYYGSDFGTLLLADGWVTYSGSTLSFCVMPRDVMRVLKLDKDTHSRDFVEVLLADESVVRFQALDWFPVVARTPRGAPPYGRNADNLIPAFQSFLESAANSPTLGETLFPPDMPRDGLLTPPWRAAARTSLAIQTLQLGLLVAILLAPPQPYYQVGYSLLGIFFVYVATLVSLPTYLRGFPALRNSRLGRLIIARSKRVRVELGSEIPPTPPRLG